ncbi:MAG: polysaccharide biosynthesis protein [Micromonosporaceae bacterium]
MRVLTEPVRRLFAALPAGTAIVGAGLAILGVAAYVYLAIAGHALDAQGYGDLAVLWMIVFSVGPGLFFPLEQELSRLVAGRRAQGLGVRPIAVRISVVGAAILAALLVATVVLRRPLADALFEGRASLVDVLVVNLAALTAAHLSRGLLSGHGEFGRYGAQLAADGLLRCGLAAVLAGAGVHDAVWYGLALAVAPLLAVLVTLNRTVLLPAPGPSVPYAEVTAGMGLLVASSTLWLALVNAGVVSARLLSTPAEAGLAGALLSGVVLARIPLFAFSSVQASLLPALSGAAATGDRTGFRRLLARTTVAVTALGVAGAAVCIAIGPWLVRTLFDAGSVLSRGDFAWLTIATTIYMVATVLGQAGLALSGHRDQALGWAAGFGSLLLVTLLPGSILMRVELAFLVGSAVAAVVLAVQLVRRIRQWPAHPAAPVPATQGAGLTD